MGVRPDGFEAFAAQAGPRLRHALVAAYGLDVGVDAASEAMAYGYERWGDLSAMANPQGYLYRVGQTSHRWAVADSWHDPDDESGEGTPRSFTLSVSEHPIYFD